MRVQLRQAEGLAEKQAGGTALTAEEADKVAKLPSWWVRMTGIYKWDGCTHCQCVMVCDGAHMAFVPGLHARLGVELGVSLA